MPIWTCAPCNSVSHVSFLEGAIWAKKMLAVHQVWKMIRWIDVIQAERYIIEKEETRQRNSALKDMRYLNSNNQQQKVTPSGTSCYLE